MKHFTTEQLVLESRPLSEMAMEALEARDLDRLCFLLGRMSVGHQELYVGYILWIARMLGEIHKDMGEDFRDKVLRESASFLMAPYVKEFLKGEEKSTFFDIVSLWRSQMGKIRSVSETPDEISLSLIPCGSGGRLILEAWSETHPALYPCSSDGSPVFCQACQALQQAMNDGCGATVWRMEPDKKLAGTCRMSFFKHKTRGERLLGIMELHELGKPRCEQALERIQRGDLNIHELIKDQHLEWRPLHDLLVLWVSALLTAVYREQGTEYLAGLLRKTYSRMFTSIYITYPALDTESLFRNMVRIWHYHQASFQVREEEDRFVFLLDPCGSGGRLYRGEMGKGGFSYGTGMLCLMKEPADINFNRSAFPIYCTHCAATNRDQFEGKPWAFLVDGGAMKDPFSPCVQYLYKKEGKRSISTVIPAQVGISTIIPLDEDYVV